jgi:hypothetical protein
VKSFLLEDIEKSNEKQWVEGKTTQWSKEKGQKDKLWSAKHYTEIKDWAIRSPLKTVGKLWCLGAPHCNLKKTLFFWNNEISFIIRAIQIIRILRFPQFVSYSQRHFLFHIFQVVRYSL